jgi:protein TonB
VKGDDGGNIDIPPAGPGNDATESNKIETIATVEVMPQFPGGETAWSKFLQKNLRYPQEAIDAGVSGKVFISFVVEKDGHLSNITVMRGVGYGLEQEAIRVLKLVPPWKPGIQNGQPVRVQYNMPFNFQIPPTD